MNMVLVDVLVYASVLQKLKRHGLWTFRYLIVQICITIAILDINHRPVFYLETNISETILFPSSGILDTYATDPLEFLMIAYI
jgi:hypothetical protein